MSKYDCLDEEIGEVSDEGHVAFSIERRQRFWPNHPLR